MDGSASYLKATSLNQPTRRNPNGAPYLERREGISYLNIFYPSICLLVNAWDEGEAESAVDRLSGGGLVGPLAAVRRPRRQDDEHLLQELGAALFTEGRERTT